MSELAEGGKSHCSKHPIGGGMNGTEYRQNRKKAQKCGAEAQVRDSPSASLHCSVEAPYLSGLSRPTMAARCEKRGIPHRFMAEERRSERDAPSLVRSSSGSMGRVPTTLSSRTGRERIGSRGTCNDCGEAFGDAGMEQETRRTNMQSSSVSVCDVGFAAV